MGSDRFVRFPKESMSVGAGKEAEAGFS